MKLGGEISLTDKFSASLGKINKNILGFHKNVDESTASIQKLSKQAQFLSKLTIKPTVKFTQQGFENIKNNIFGIKGLIAGAGAALGAIGLYNLTKDAINQGEDIYQMATILHTSGQEARSLSGMLSLADVSTKTFTNSFLRFDKAVEFAGKHGNVTTKGLAQMGVVLTDTKGKLLPIPDQLNRMSVAYNKLDDAGKEAFTSLLGPRGADLTPILEDYKELSSVTSKVTFINLDATKAHQTFEWFKAIDLQMSQFKLALAAAFLPFSEKLAPVFMNSLSKLATAFNSHSGALKTMAGDMGDKVAKVFNDMEKNIEKVTNTDAFRKADWGGKLGMLADAATKEVVPKMVSLGLTIGTVLADGIGEGIAIACKKNPLLGVVLGVYAGSAFGPWGALIGGVGGGIASLGGSAADKYSAFWNGLADSSNKESVSDKLNADDEANRQQNIQNQKKDEAALIANQPWRAGQILSAAPKKTWWQRITGHASGLPRVPYDNYPALLHQNERVLTAAESKQYSGSGSNRMPVQINVNLNGANIHREVIDLLFQELFETNINMPAIARS